MEDVLDVYKRPYDEKHPTVCMDETSKQLLKETRIGSAAEPGQLQRYDYEYERKGVSQVFMFFEPLCGWRHVKVTDRRTKKEWAECMRDLVDLYYPEAERIAVVLDNLNTHKLSSLYEAYEPVEARRIAERLELHYTPKHGSWLNMAEIELSVLGRQCLARRIPDKESLKQEVEVWEKRRNSSGAMVYWRFTTSDARIKLKRLYPSIED